MLATSRPLYCSLCGRRNAFRASSSPASSAALEERLERLEERPRRPSVVWASSVPVKQPRRARSDLEAWERVTGGLCMGVFSLLGGQRGTGKTRLALAVAGGVRRTLERPVLVCPLEMKTERTRAFMASLELEPDGIALHDDPSWDSIATMIEELDPALVILDAFKLVELGGRAAEANTAQEKELVRLLRELLERRAERTAVLATLHNQASQAGYSVGSKPLQLSDLIVRLDRVPEERTLATTRAAADAIEKDAPIVRLSVDEKNRWGPDTRTADFASTGRGLVPL